MKCNEELPECRNCRIRQVKLPCSYLSFTKDEMEEFKRNKADNGHDNDNENDKDNYNDNDNENDLQDTAENAKVAPQLEDSIESGFKIRLVPHIKNSTLKSQHHCFFQEPRISLGGRLYFVKLINDSFLNFNMLSSHLTLASVWLHSQLSKKFKALSKNNLLNDDETEDYERDLKLLLMASTKFKSECLIFLRDKIIEIMNYQNIKDCIKAFRAYNEISIPTYALQCSDVITQENLKLYYINGSMMVLKEFYASTVDSSPIASFIAQSSFSTQRALFIPNYSFEILYEFFGVVQELKPFITKTNDVYLIDGYYALLEFLKNDLLNTEIRDNYDKSHIVPYPPAQLYTIFHKFYKIIPSQVFTIDTTTSPVHSLFYSFFYTLSRVLDNIFPETRYITQFRFIGPTLMYPYDEDQFYQMLTPELLRLGRYSLRVMAFFSRRSEFFWKYMKVLNPFPENLAANRFRSRKARIDEVFIDKFKSTILERRHYPQVLLKLHDQHHDQHLEQDDDGGENDEAGYPSPASSTDSFSTNFNTMFALNLDFSSEFSKINFDTHTELTNFFGDYDELELEKNFLLKSDYDPLVEDWVEERSTLNADKLSLHKFMEDREVLMRGFIN